MALQILVKVALSVLKVLRSQMPEIEGQLIYLSRCRGRVAERISIGSDGLIGGVDQYRMLRPEEDSSCTFWGQTLRHVHCDRDC